MSLAAPVREATPVRETVTVPLAAAAREAPAAPVAAVVREGTR